MTKNSFVMEVTSKYQFWKTHELILVFLFICHSLIHLFVISLHGSELLEIFLFSKVNIFIFEKTI